MRWDSDTGLSTTETFTFNKAILFLFTQQLSVKGSGQIHFLYNVLSLQAEITYPSNCQYDM